MDCVNNLTCSLADWAGVSGHHWEPSGLASQVSNEKKRSQLNLNCGFQARAVTALLEESRREGWGPPQDQVGQLWLSQVLNQNISCRCTCVNYTVGNSEVG